MKTSNSSNFNKAADKTQTNQFISQTPNGQISLNEYISSQKTGNTMFANAGNMIAGTNSGMTFSGSTSLTQFPTMRARSAKDYDLNSGQALGVTQN